MSTINLSARTMSASDYARKQRAQRVRKEAAKNIMAYFGYILLLVPVFVYQWVKMILKTFDEDKNTLTERIITYLVIAGLLIIRA